MRAGKIDYKRRKMVNQEKNAGEEKREGGNLSGQRYMSETESFDQLFC